MKSSKILVVEDEKDIRELMSLHLRRDSHEVIAVENGEEAQQLLKKDHFDLGVFDWMLPGVSGLELCKLWKDKLPILMVTARADSSDIVLGLELGASDYITKPFDIPVFLARVRSLLRRNAPKEGPKNILKIGNLFADLDRVEAKCGDQIIQLTLSEFKLLTALMKNPGRALSRDMLIAQVQGQGIAVTDRTIDTHVVGLRKKLGSCGECIETIRGIGYRVRSE